MGSQNLIEAIVVISINLAASAACCADDVSLIVNGLPVAKIYTGGEILKEMSANSEESDTEKEARKQAHEELNYHLKKMSGVELEVITTDRRDSIETPAIVLGELAVKLGAVPQKASTLKEGFRILTKDNMVLIGGESDWAVLLGCYEFLSKLGCDWVMPGEIGEIIPRRETVRFPGMDESQAPDFDARNLWYHGWKPRNPEDYARFGVWIRRQKGSQRNHPMYGASGHVWGGFIKRHEEEFDADPTMLALRRASDGTMKRMGPQLESTHPRVVELFVQDIKDKYRRNIEAGIWTKDTVAAFGIGPADGLGYSMSAESMLAGSGRIDPIIGEPDRTDELVLLGNRILEEVHKEYPNACVGFYSYSTHADYPARYKPNPNIVPIFAPISFSRFHSLLDPESKSQAYYRDVVEQWARLSREQGNVLIFRGYNWNLAENMLPYSKVKIWGQELPFYKAHGFVALNVEATKAWSVNGPSDYVFMRLAWDTSLDWREILREYCVKSFGDGAKPMEQYLRRIIERQQTAGQEAGSYHAFHLLYDHGWVRDSQKLIDEALAAAKSEEQKTRVRFFDYGLNALELYLNYHDATMRFDFPAVRAAYDAMIDHWEKTYSINPDLVANQVPQYLKRFVVSFVEDGLKYSSEPYSIVYKIPDELPTMFDPNEVGHRMSYQSPHINDSGFIRTKTYSTTWDAQGLGGLRSEAVWYRVHFALTGDVKGQPVGLFIGGVDDEARVWLNGKAVGASGRGFSAPFVFDLTDDVKYDGDNLLAIQVVRNSKSNELSLGGIIRPSFIFTGPRLESKAPNLLELRRILPGGELGDIEE